MTGPAKLTLSEVKKWLEEKKGFPLVILDCGVLLLKEDLNNIINEVEKLSLAKSVGIHNPNPLERFGVSCLLAGIAKDLENEG